MELRNIARKKQKLSQNGIEKNIPTSGSNLDIVVHLFTF